MNKILYKVAKVYRATFLSWLHPVSLPQQAVQYWKIANFGHQISGSTNLL